MLIISSCVHVFFFSWSCNCYFVAVNSELNSKVNIKYIPVLSGAWMSWKWKSKSWSQQRNFKANWWSLKSGGKRPGISLLQELRYLWPIVLQHHLVAFVKLRSRMKVFITSCSQKSQNYNITMNIVKEVSWNRRFKQKNEELTFHFNSQEGVRTLFPSVS